MELYLWRKKEYNCFTNKIIGQNSKWKIEEESIKQKYSIWEEVPVLELIGGYWHFLNEYYGRII